MKQVVLLGTGTGVGKTHLGCCLLHELRVRGVNALGLKPVESGIGGEEVSDGDRLAGFSGGTIETAPFRMREPISPHLAARREGRRIGISEIAAWVERQRAEVRVIETAGGVLSPLNERETNLDLALAAGGDLVLVTLDRLGVLHDTAAVLLALAGRKAKLAAVAMNAPGVADASTGTNAAELEALHGIQVVSFPRAEPSSAESGQAAGRLLELWANGAAALQG